MRRPFALLALAIPLAGCASFDRTPVITVDAAKSLPVYAGCIAADLQARQSDLGGTVSLDRLDDQNTAIIGIADSRGVETNIRVTGAGPESAHATAVHGIVGMAQHYEFVDFALRRCAAG